MNTSNSTLQIAASPKDLKLYAIIDDARYPLTPAREDVILNGKWNDKQVIPESWVKETLTPHSTIDKTPYSYLWWHPWLNVNGIRNNAVAARGNGGQRIYLRPDLNMVVVITGGNYNSESAADKLLANYILPAFNK